MSLNNCCLKDRSGGGRGKKVGFMGNWTTKREKVMFINIYMYRKRERMVGLVVFGVLGEGGGVVGGGRVW